MIRVNCPPLPPHINRFLQNRRNNNRDWTCYKPTQVQKDEEMYGLLENSFSKRCGYCERRGKHTIDHFCPRNPDIPIEYHPCNTDRTWDWDNFILSCEDCQKRKLNTSPVHPDGYLMINPRVDEPLRYLRIEPDTGILAPVITEGQSDLRGEYTISVLKFNQRSDLDNDRQEKFTDILELIVEIVDPNSSSEIVQHSWRELRKDLRPSRPPHMVTQQIFSQLDPDIAPLIDKLYEVIPEAWEILAPFRRTL